MLDISNGRYDFELKGEKYYEYKINGISDVDIFDITDAIERRNRTVLVDGKKTKVSGYGVVVDYMNDSHRFWIEVV